MDFRQPLKSSLNDAQNVEKSGDANVPSQLDLSSQKNMQPRIDRSHQLDKIEQNHPTAGFAREMQVNRQTLGSAYAERFYMEMRAAAQVDRFGMESSRFHMDLLLGKDETIGVEDYLKHPDINDRI